MIRVIVVYHSEKNRTRTMAQFVCDGAASCDGVEAETMPVEAIDWTRLQQADAIIFGAPTYMGSVSASFKKFMDDSGTVWLKQGWKDKLAAGFVTSYGYSGDKLNVLVQMALYAAQHGMVWIGSAEPVQGNQPHHVNRLGSFLGVMAQSDATLDSVEPPSGDRQTGYLLGVRVARMALRFRDGADRKIS